MIKAAFFDLDGTLFSYHNHTVSHATVATFQKLRALGIRTFVATGRTPIIIPNMPLTFDGYITMTGGLVYCGNTTLVRQPIPRQYAETWYQYAKKHHISTICFTDTQMFINHIDDQCLQLRDYLDFDSPQVLSEDEMMLKDNFQIIAIVPPKEDDAIKQMMPQCTLPRWHSMFTDIVLNTNSKSNGVKAVCEHFGINLNDTIAFGDGGNDIDMLELCGIGVAMGNAADHVKRHADYITSDVEEEGITKAFEHFRII
ncbi:MAG: Cof-type HAD-IIB family hydrolase [Bacteroidales bacterium]|nr:Cof-type HAD-IIB family hydrolase [Candidatus Colimorpha onthohippi]